MTSIGRVCRRIDALPTLDCVSAGDRYAAMCALVALRTDVARARRHAWASTRARTLLREAHAWVDAWLIEWENGKIPHCDLVDLYRQMLRHLAKVAVRLSAVVESDVSRAPRPAWPSVERDPAAQSARRGSVSPHPIPAGLPQQGNRCEH